MSSRRRYNSNNYDYQRDNKRTKPDSGGRIPLFQKVDDIEGSDIKDLLGWQPSTRGIQNLSISKRSDWNFALKVFLNRSEVATFLTELESKQQAEKQKSTFNCFEPYFSSMGEQMENNAKLQQAMFDKLDNLKSFDKSIGKKISPSKSVSDSDKPKKRKDFNLDVEEGEEESDHDDVDQNYIDVLNKIAPALSTSSNVSEQEFEIFDRKIRRRGQRDINLLEHYAKALGIKIQPKLPSNIGMHSKRVVDIMEKCAEKLKQKATKRK